MSIQDQLLQSLERMVAPTLSLQQKADEHALEARMNVKYHGERSRRFARRDRVTRLLAVFASLIACAAASGVYEGTLVMKGSVVACLLFTGSAAVMAWSERAQEHATLYREWLNLRFRWERLERCAETPKGLPMFDELLVARNLLMSREPSSPDLKLLEKMLEEVERETGRDVHVAVSAEP
jgi:hypothetical protein